MRGGRASRPPYAGKVTAVTIMLSPAPGRADHAPGPTRNRNIQQGMRERLAPYAYVAPFFLLFFIFGLFPLLFTFYVALFDWDPIGERRYVGLANFSELVDDPRFWGALRNTFSIWVLSTVPQLLLALVVAHVLNHVRLRAATLFRMSVLVPYITSVAATTIVFAQLFDRDYGMLNWFLGLLGFQHFDFTASVWGSHVMIAAMVTWRWTGYNTLLYLASLQSVPRELYEAAAVGRCQRLEAVPPHHHPLAAADHRVHGRHVDDRTGCRSSPSRCWPTRWADSRAGRHGSARPSPSSSTSRDSAGSTSATARPSASRSSSWS